MSLIITRTSKDKVRIYSNIPRLCQGPPLLTIPHSSSLRLTECKRLPRSLCGAGCSYREGEEECHDKREVTVTRTPHETCDVQPVKTCRFVTKLAPRLKPVQKCSSVPRQVCNRKYRKVSTTPPSPPSAGAHVAGEEGEARPQPLVRRDREEGGG